MPLCYPAGNSVSVKNQIAGIEQAEVSNRQVSNTLIGSGLSQISWSDLRRQ
jgi:hypothetical protein